MMSACQVFDMLVVDLSALSKPELQRLLKAARSHAEPSLAAELVSELAFREGGAQPPAPMAQASGRRWGRRLAGLAAAVGALMLVVWAWVQTPSAPHNTEAAPLALASRSAPAAPTRISDLNTAPPSPDTTSAQARTRIDVAASSLRPEITAPRPTAPNPCYAERAPADRLVCGYPTLGAQDRRLREAYVQALAAGAHAEDLEASQMEWKAQRDGLADRHQLAAFYADRISALEAAASAARAAEPPV